MLFTASLLCKDSPDPPGLHFILGSIPPWTLCLSCSNVTIKTGALTRLVLGRCKHGTTGHLNHYLPMCLMQYTLVAELSIFWSVSLLKLESLVHFGIHFSPWSPWSFGLRNLDGAEDACSVPSFTILHLYLTVSHKPSDKNLLCAGHYVLKDEWRKEGKV